MHTILRDIPHLMPPRVDQDVVGRLTPSMNGNQEFTQHPDLNAQT
jgi:hypothetical protein